MLTRATRDMWARGFGCVVVPVGLGALRRAAEQQLEQLAPTSNPSTAQSRRARRRGAETLLRELAPTPQCLVEYCPEGSHAGTLAVGVLGRSGSYLMDLAHSALPRHGPPFMRAAGVPLCRIAAVLPGRYGDAHVSVLFRREEGRGAGARIARGGERETGREGGVGGDGCRWCRRNWLADFRVEVPAEWPVARGAEEAAATQRRALASAQAGGDAQGRARRSRGGVGCWRAQAGQVALSLEPSPQTHNPDTPTTTTIPTTEHTHARVRVRSVPYHAHSYRRRRRRCRRCRRHRPNAVPSLVKEGPTSAVSLDLGAALRERNWRSRKTALLLTHKPMASVTPTDAQRAALSREGALPRGMQQLHATTMPVWREVVLWL